MDLSKICINARTRSPWEAIDLGVVLARAWWLPLFLIWFVPAFTIFFSVSAIFPDYNWVAYLLVWWLKPLLDRGPLYIASRRLFNEPIGFWAAFRRLPSLYRHDAFAWLTFRRFSLTRSFDMPLTLLEQLRGKARSSRLSVLHRQYGGVAYWLSIICLHIEMFLIIGVVSFVILMVPENIELDYWQLMLTKQDAASWLYNVFAFLMMCLVAPFYTVCGFCLYISRRIDLEAWDIEIRFRHLAAEFQKRQKLTTPNAKVLPVVLCLCLAGWLHLAPQPTYAQDDASPVSVAVTPDALEASSRSVLAVEAKKHIVDVLAGDEFHQIEKVSGWRLKNIEQKREEEIPEWLITLIEKLIKFFAAFDGPDGVWQNPMLYVEYVLWGLFFLVIAIVVFRYRESIRFYIRQTRKGKIEVEAPDSLFGLDVRKESLPEDVPVEVLKLWQQELYREAVSLLYRSLLGALIHHHQFEFSVSDTENECVSIVKRCGNEELSQYAQKLTSTWQQLAYGHQLPLAEEVENLCSAWTEVFPRA